MDLIRAIEVIQGTYDRLPDIVGPLDDHPIRLHFEVVDNVLVVIPEGSKTEEDWLGNLEIWRVRDKDPPDNHPEFGWHHYDFLASSASVLDAVEERVRGQPYYIDGHSRGAIQGVMLAGLLALRGQHPTRVFAFEPPRGFFLRIPAVYSDIVVEGCWNGNDPVPAVPFGWEQFPLHVIGKPEWRPIMCHHLPSVLGSAKDAQQAGVLS